MSELVKTKAIFSGFEGDELIQPVSPVAVPAGADRLDVEHLPLGEDGLLIENPDAIAYLEPVASADHTVAPFAPAENFIPPFLVDPAVPAESDESPEIPVLDIGLAAATPSHEASPVLGIGPVAVTPGPASGLDSVIPVLSIGPAVPAAGPTLPPSGEDTGRTADEFEIPPRPTSPAARPVAAPATPAEIDEALERDEFFSRIRHIWDDTDYVRAEKTAEGVRFHYENGGKVHATPSRIHYENAGAVTVENVRAAMLHAREQWSGRIDITGSSREFVVLAMAIADLEGITVNSLPEGMERDFLRPEVGAKVRELSAGYKRNFPAAGRTSAATARPPAPAPGG